MSRIEGRLTGLRPVIPYSQTVPVAAAGVVLAVALGAIYSAHSQLSSILMIGAVLVSAAAFIRLLGPTMGVIVLLIATCMIDQWVFSVGRFNIRPEQVAMIVALGTFAWMRVREHRSLLVKPSATEALLLAWFAVGLVSSVLLAQNRVESLKILALLAISSLAMFLPRRMIGSDQALMEQAAGWLLLAFAMEGAYATGTYFLHLFGPTVGLGINPATNHLDALGTMWEPNVLGAICGGGAMAWLVLGPRYYKHAWIGVALCLSGCVGSFTRTAWIAVLFMLILGVATPVRNRLDLRALAMGLLATLLLIVGIFAADSAGHYTAKGGANTVSTIGNGTDIIGRLNQFGPVFQDLRERKLRLVIGGGIDSYGQRHILQGVPQHLANLEISVLNDTGAIGIIVFVAFGVWLLRAAWRTRRDLTVLGLGSVVLLLAITNTATETLELMITWLLIGLLLAAVDVAQTVSVPETARTAPGSAA